MKKIFMLVLMFTLIMNFYSYSGDNSAAGKTNEEVSMITLKNGMKLIVKENPANEIFAAVCLVDAGSLFETTDKVGITNFVQKLLLKGTKTRTAEEIADSIESVGGSIGASASPDYAQASVISLSEDASLALDVLSDVLFNPIFLETEIEKERKLILEQMKLQEDDTFSWTYKNFLETLYEGHNYQFEEDGVEQTVKAITKEDLEQYHKKFYVPSNMILSVVSNLSKDKVQGIVEKYFGMASPVKPAKIMATKDFEIKARSKVLKKKVEQGFITAGYITCPVISEDYPALKVANSILGEGMSSRTFRELRQKKSLAYAVGTISPSKRDKSHFMGYIGTKPETVQEAKDGLLEVFQGLSEKEVSAEELEKAKNHIAGIFLMDHEQNSRQAWYLAWFEIIGKGYKYDDEYPAAIRKVTAKDVMKVANKYFLSPTVVYLEPEEKE